jgi:hypothetical protein
MDNKSGVSIAEVIFVCLLTAIFATLKIIGIISWPWIWVLAPVWVSGIIMFTKAMGVDIPTGSELIAGLRDKFRK